ncbi:MAG: Cytochrome c biogenesis protein [Candidatus Moranbacteria bacterium GW2011_GWE2_35_2-]|nr:MAG: Cytochrome c biogenesis protein [Candidatus Moranbacteria bacterium GW2011_GWE2_35_2-]KKQ06542.1 MAG: Cytochrome c biogenesis protein [Candidatus Moranbacteria bacterium GW2011_GWF1_36_4]KKQ21898.1 MAG: Cytochrome c biogenesis protein [Candidatus Moranbacteria bacterium GW2011_GWF2_37_11]KKQ29423.1 MAG: Cytochrome c biogenesis protein [Candidatus Moranbacteria bacterium GW2011_GWD1_37_17]KKQ30708.1 MAG: Cytochrome c biogenesis protein [Candidatus Moranbacteria bacterium GW2011_GWE1_37_2
MKIFKLVFILLMMFVFAFPVFAQDSKKQAVYFYASWCAHCQNVEAYFEKEGFYDKYDIVKLDYDKEENKILLAKIFSAKGYKNLGIPAIIIDNQLISGDEPIIKNFVKRIESSNGTAVDFVNGFAEEESKVSSDGLSFPVLIGAALVDAINPCAFAVLIILVATVVGAQGRKKALWSGLLFSLAVFISYFLMGLGLYKVITIFNLPKIISIIVGVLAIVIGLANLKDAFWHGKVFLMEVPMSWRPKMKSILKNVTSPLGALGAGFLVSLFLLPCTSGPYIVVLGLLAEKVQISRTLLLLTVYNLIFVLPMVMITLAMYFGLRGGKMEQWRTKNIHLLHGAAGVIMTGIGVYLIVSWL